MAGRCSLCFLEQVDQLIGKDHLFKRSILLIKAWCHYESRILGAHNGLISAYALDLMILYIINMFYSSLESPLAVLYKFLDYYNTFEWEKYCITLYGRVAIPSLPHIVVEKEEGNGCDLLLTKECLENCVPYFSIPTRVTETGEQFPVKFLNIMDPLKSSNNLGRSVNRANLYRIQSALNLGTRKLQEVLMGPAESREEELRNFFRCTIGRNRPDEQFRFPVFGDVGRLGISNLGRNYGNTHSPSNYSQDNCPHSLPVPPQPRPQILYPRAQNPTPCIRYRWADFSQRTMNEFFPREIGHQNASQLLSSPFGVREREIFLTRGPTPSLGSIRLQNAMARASGMYVPNMGAESSNSRGTGMFIPTLTVREQWVPRGTGMGVPDMGALNLEGTSTSIYETGPGGPETNRETGRVGLANLQGPATSIADTSYIDTDSWEYKKKRVMEWVEVDLKEAQNDFESCFDLSKEEFLFLSSSNRALASESGPSGADNEGCSSGMKIASPPRGHSSVWPTAETEAGECDPSVAAPPEGCH